MPTPLLATKLIVPTPGKVRVDRPHLAARLDEILHPSCRLALVSAPAGFGKTTLVGAWAAGLPGTADASPWLAWLSLDAGDNDPVVFWSYAIAALQTCQPGLGAQALDLLQSDPSSPEPEAHLAGLLNELAQVTRPFILVLDDFHLIRQAAIHRSLAYFIDRASDSFHLLLLSRTDPPLPLARLRGRGRLLEIRMHELRFSLEDAQAFLNAGMGLALDPQAVQLLHGKTEGWIAGLQMAALSLREAASLQDRARVEAFIDSFSGSNRYILDYLMEEVLNQQPAGLQRFLLKTSILDRLCGPLCDAVLQDEPAVLQDEPAVLQDEPAVLQDKLAVLPDEPGLLPSSAQAVLEQLESSNLFILSLDDQRTWYRYHQLFAELLKKRLHQSDPGSVPVLHRRAIQWYEQNGLIPQAVEHAFLIKDYPKAADLVSRVVEALWGRGEHVTLLGWLAALPEAEKRRYPSLWVFEVSMLITAGEMQTAERRVQEIESFLQTAAGGEPDGTTTQAALAAQVSVLRTYIASFYRDIPGVLRHAHQALAQLSGEAEAGSRCGVSLVLANAYLDIGDLPAAVETLTQAVAAGKAARKPAMLLTALANQAIVLYLQGDLAGLAPVCQAGLHLVEHDGQLHSPSAASLWVAQGLRLCEQHALEEAERFIQRGLELAQERSYIWQTAWGYLAQLRLRLAQGRLEAVEPLVQATGQLAARHPVPAYYTAAISGLAALAWLRAGQLEAAARHLEQHAIRVEGEVHYPHEAEYWALAHLYLAQGRPAAAAGLVERLLPRAEAGQQPLWVIRWLLLQTRLEQSLPPLERALALAEVQGSVQVFLDEGEPLRLLLAAAVQDLPAGQAAYARQLLSAFPVSPAGPAAQRTAVSRPPVSGRPPVPVEDALVEPLTGREMDVLRLIAAGHANKEIAQKLSVSLRTVKFYATTLYAKLGVTGRTQAIHRARELGLLE